MMRFCAFYRRFMAAREGFSLVVVAALFGAFAITIGAYLERTTATVQYERQEKAREQLSRLSMALQLYKHQYGRYPCPASYAVLPSEATFGSAFTYTTTACDTPPAVGQTLDAFNFQLVRGMVPVRTLIPYGISLEDAFDPWSSRIMYTVNRTFTPGTSEAYNSARAFTITDITLGITYSSAASPGYSPDFVLVSYGRDRRGGYSRHQTSFSSPIAGCNGATRRSTNCNQSATYYIGALSAFSTVAAADYFDDIVSYAQTTTTSCPAQTYSWSVGGRNCSGPMPALAHGGSAVISSTATNISTHNSVTVTCNSGTITPSGAVCNSAGISSCTVPVPWQTACGGTTIPDGASCTGTTNPAANGNFFIGAGCSDTTCAPNETVIWCDNGNIRGTNVGAGTVYQCTWAYTNKATASCDGTPYVP